MDAEPQPPSPWHPGERRLQTLAGVSERMAELGPRVIRDHMPDQHRELFARLPFIVLGTVDDDGRPWATLLAATPGFVAAPDPTTLTVGRAADAGDPAGAGIRDGAAVGVLGIEPATRRRNRANGTVRSPGPGGFEVAVTQSFGNCPRYIRPRRLELRSAGVTGPAVWLDGPDTAAADLIRGADTCFVASYTDAPHRQVDVSHRGGAPGFIRVGRDGTLVIPDYAGNRFFNTLGNLLATPRAGLLFADFASGDLLQLSGSAEVLSDGRMLDDFPAAERLWMVRPALIVRRPGALGLRAVPLPGPG